MKHRENKINVRKTKLLSKDERLKIALKYFNQIKKCNRKLKELGFNLSDRYSTICLFDGDNENPIDSM